MSVIATLKLKPSSSFYSMQLKGGRDSVVSITTWYGLDSSRLEPQCEPDFSAHIEISHGEHPAPVKQVQGLPTEVRQQRHGIDQSPPSGAEVIKRVELYIYSPSVPSWPVLGSLPFIQQKGQYVCAVPSKAKPVILFYMCSLESYNTECLVCFLSESSPTIHV